MLQILFILTNVAFILSLVGSSVDLMIPLVLHVLYSIELDRKVITNDYGWSCSQYISWCGLRMSVQPVGSWPLFQFLNLYTVGRTPSRGDRPVARQLPVDSGLATG
jgi:hypothetical protein